VIPRPIRWCATWLLSDDERGEAVLGDLEEIAAGWRAERGAFVAGLLAAYELLRSAGPLLGSAAADRGAALLVRSVPALAAGCLTVALPAAVGGGSPGHASLAFLVALAVGSVMAVVGGEVAAAIAGAAPRQHGLAVGVTLASAAAVLAATGRISPPLWLLTAWSVALVVSAAYGGARYRRARHGLGKENAGATPSR